MKALAPLGWLLIVVGNIIIYFFPETSLLIPTVTCVMGFLLLIVHTTLAIPKLNTFRKIVNIVGLVCIAGAFLGIAGAGIYQLNKHRVTGHDNKNIRENANAIDLNQKATLRTLDKIQQELEEFEESNQRFPYPYEVENLSCLSGFSKIPSAGIYKTDGYLISLQCLSDWWFCYAWPEKYGISGVRSYYANDTDARVKWTERKFSGVKNRACEMASDFWQY